MGRKIYRISFPMSFFIILANSILLAFVIWSIATRSNLNPLGYGSGIQVWIVLFVAVVVSTSSYALVKWGTRKWTYQIVAHVTDHEEAPSVLEINGVRLRPDEVASIHVEGYFSPIVGVKLHNQKIVSPRLTFRFAEEGEDGIKFLQCWARRHDITWQVKPFKRWV